MAATVQGTAFIVGIGSVALTNMIPVNYTEESIEVSSVQKDGDGVAVARVVKDTAMRYTLTGPYTTKPTAVAGDALSITTDGGSVTCYVESTRATRQEDPAQFEITAIKEAGIAYS